MNRNRNIYIYIIHSNRYYIFFDNLIQIDISLGELTLIQLTVTKCNIYDILFLDIGVGSSKTKST